MTRVAVCVIVYAVAEDLFCAFCGTGACVVCVVSVFDWYFFAIILVSLCQGVMVFQCISMFE